MEQKRFPIFAERFAELRGEMTQSEFADFLSISRPTVGFYENGTRIPDALTLRQIAERCGVSSDWLVGLSDVQTPVESVRQICDYTGLSETAVQMLRVIKDINAITGLNTLMKSPGFIVCCRKFTHLISSVEVANEYERKTQYLGEDISCFDKDNIHEGLLLRGYDICDHLYQSLVHETLKILNSESGLESLRNYVTTKRHEGFVSMMREATTNQKSK